MIEIQHLTKTFGKLRALDDVSLRLERGQCIALIGPNGCGKTTLIKSMLGMVPPDPERIFFQGQDIDRQWHYRQQIGYMPQIGRYPENMSIGQVLGMMRDIRRMPERSLDRDLLDAFGLETMLGKRMGTLSGGTRQKVSACLAFMFEADMYILDEPTAGLDPLSVDILREKIIAEKNRDKLILITSHVLSELDDLASQVVYMQDGRVLFHKALADLQRETETDRLSRAIARVMAGRENRNESL